VHLSDTPVAGGQLWPILFLGVLPGASITFHPPIVFSLDGAVKVKGRLFFGRKKMDLFSEIHF
jgi:hypothetical protein